MHTPPRLPSALIMVFVAVQTVAGAAERQPPTAEHLAFFEEKVRPLLIARCYECHSEDKEVNGGLRLDTRAGWEQGGDSGPAIMAGKPDESRLIEAVRYQNFDLKMPPTGRLPDAQVAILEEWVRLGAPDPREDAPKKVSTLVDHAQARAHWAFQPLMKAGAPKVQDAQWPLCSTDVFVLASLEQKRLHPSPDADRHTWLRRVSLDLTGLPPTAPDIESFLNDQLDGAWERVVDRLLGSRAFGERWARAWLDLVGYADQIGSANDVPAEHAWRYRDYVIRALCADKPFDVFTREQLAGDLLTAAGINERQDQLIATGFLVLGNVNIVEADKLVMRMDLVDRQIEKVGKAFLGMTLNCARCHDHKFDPITVDDYYGLAGIFASTESTYKAQRGVWSSVTKTELPETLDQFNRRQAAFRAHERKVASVMDERAAVEARQKTLQGLLKAAKEASATPAVDANRIADLQTQADERAAKAKGLERQRLHLDYLKPQAPVAFAVRDSPDISDAKVQVRGNPHVVKRAVPRGFVQVATQGAAPPVADHQSGRLELARWLNGAASPLVARVTVNRVWQKLFGQGIVGSVDYFGLRGDSPTHPELLDHLASQFIHDGWSLKRLIRGIVLSRTYRQQSAANGASHLALAADPDNRLLWRMRPRRLDAEMLRDAVLAVSGGLEPCEGGPALAPEFIENVGGLDPTSANPISFTVTKFRDNQPRLRTIYLPVVRSSEQRGPGEVLNFFDFAQPAQLAGDRGTTTVASQALFLLNGPLLKGAAERLVGNLHSDARLTSDDDRLATLYLRVLNRPATAEETAAASAFLGASDVPQGANSSDSDRAAAWRRLTHALLVSNDFLFRL